MALGRDRQKRQSTAPTGNTSTWICGQDLVDLAGEAGDAVTAFTRGFRVRSQIRALEPRGRGEGHLSCQGLALPKSELRLSSEQH